MNDFKTLISNDLKNVLFEKSFIIAAWEGGSAATGFEDMYSDLDLAVLAEDGKTEDVFIVVEEYLQKNYGINRIIRMPEPAWHGMSQCFYLIDGAPEYFYIDMAVMKESVQDPLLEKERHGIAKVWFDRKGFVVTTTIDWEKYRPKMKAAYARTILFFPLMYVEFMKNSARNSIIESWSAYSKLLAMFIALMNLKYRPEKFDFMSRYIERDYPAEEATLMQSLCMPKSMTEMRTNAKYVEKRFWELAEDLRESYGVDNCI